MGPSKSWGKFETVSGETLKIQIFLIGGKFKKWSNVLTNGNDFYQSGTIFYNENTLRSTKIYYQITKMKLL